MKKHIFRRGALAAAVAGLTLLASCDFMECKDDDVSYSLSATSSTSFNGSYGMSTTGTATLSVTWQNWSSALTSRAASLGDLSDYFDIYLLDSSGNDITAKALTSATFTATDAVTAIDTSGTSASSGASVPVSITLKLSEPVDQSEVTGTLGFVAKPVATTSGNYLTCDSSIAFTFSEASWGLAVPTASLIAAADVSIATYTYATQLVIAANLAKAVKADVAIGKATVAGEEVTLYTASACEKGVTTIPVYFGTTAELTSSTTTMDVTYLMKYVDDSSGSTGSYGNSHTVSNVAERVYRVYYGEDYTDLTAGNISSYVAGGNATISVETDSTYGNYPNLYWGSTGGQRGGYMLTSLAAPSSGTYILEFDTILTNGGDRASSFTVVDSALTGNTDPSSGYIFKMAAPSDATQVWTVYDGNNTATSTTVTLTAGSWYHFKFEVTVDDTNGTVKVTLTPRDSSDALLDGLSLTCAGTGVAERIYAYMGRSYKTFALDNIAVYSTIE